MIKSKRSLACGLAVALISCAAIGGVSSRATAESEKEISPADLWESVNDSKIDIAEVPDYAYEKGTKGVRVTNFGAGATVKFKNIIDLTDSNYDGTLLSLYITPQTKGVHEFSGLTLTLTDVEDSSNYLEINMVRSIWWYGATFFQVSTPDVSPRGLHWGYYENEDEVYSGQAGAECLIGAFSARVNGEGTSQNPSDWADVGDVRPLVMRYDNSAHTVYYDTVTDADNVYNRGTRTRCVLNLTDSRQTGAGNEWKGFTSGRVIATLKASDFSASSASYIITNFAGIDMTAETVDDVTPPYIKCAEEGELPLAEVGKPYALPDIIAEDAIDGQIAVQTTVCKLGGEPIQVDKFFTPTERGQYTLSVAAIDMAGNSTKREFSFRAFSVLPEITLEKSFDVKSAVSVGEKVDLPEVTASGGAGRLSVKTTVSHATSSYIPKISYGQFTPELAGDYIVRYTVTDYVGTKRVFTDTVTATRGVTPICTFFDFPAAVLSGKPTELPLPEAYDYASDPAHVKKAQVEFYAQYAGGEKQKIKQVFTPDITKGDKLKIYYSVYCEGLKEHAIERAFDTTVVEVKKLADYFIMTDVTASGARRYIEFTASADGAKLAYAVPLNAANFDIAFDIKESNQFKTLALSLSDSQNSAETVTLVITRRANDAKSDVYVSGARYEMEGSFDGLSKKRFELYFNADGVVTDANGNVVVKLSTYDSGREFGGFSSGKVYTSLTFGGVTGDSSIQLASLAGQSIYDKGGEFYDIIEPIIVPEFEISVNRKLNEVVHLSAARAFDAIDPYTECFVSLKKDGKTIIEKTRAEDGGLSFTASEYGVYELLYEATDTAGNNIELRYQLRVEDDIPPAMSVGSLVNIARVGQKIKLPAAKTADNYSAVALTVYVITPTGRTEEVAMGADYTFAAEGTYRVVYSARDEAYNYTVKEFKVRVVK